jgi:hypothetical protein
MRCILLACVTLSAAAAFAQADNDASWPWRVTLTAVNPTPALYEPAIIKMEATLAAGGPPGWAGLQAPGPERPCVYRPERANYKVLSELGWLGTTAAEHRIVPPGGSSVRQYIVPTDYGDYLFSTPGVYRVVLNCAEYWIGDTASHASQRSNEVEFVVHEPRGADRDALDWAGGPGPLGDLMGLAHLVPDTNKRWNNPHRPNTQPYHYLLDIAQARKTFIDNFSHSSYAPYVLLQLVRSAYAGRTRVPPATDPARRHVYLADLPGVLLWSSRFKELYPSHPLAQEAAYLHAWANHAAGNASAAAAEVAGIERDFPDSPYPRLVTSVQTNTALWPYATMWTRTRFDPIEPLFE